MCQPGEIEEIASQRQGFGPATRILQGLSPRTKLLVLCVGLVFNLMWSSVLSSVLMAICCLALLVSSGHEPQSLVKRIAVPWYIAAVAMSTQLFLTGTTPLFQLGPINAYSEGLARGVLLGSKIVAGTSLVLAFSLTSTVTELMSLASWLRLPPVMVEISTLTYRYIFLLADEGQRIREAQSARLGHSSWPSSMRSYGMLIGMVMARSYDRAEAVYQAMAARGYRGSLPTDAGKSIDAYDLRVGALALVALAVMSWVGSAYGV